MLFLYFCSDEKIKREKNFFGRKLTISLEVWGSNFSFILRDSILFKNFIKETRFSILKVVEQKQIPNKNEIRS